VAGRLSTLVWSDVSGGPTDYMQLCGSVGPNKNDQLGLNERLSSEA